MELEKSRQRKGGQRRLYIFCDEPLLYSNASLFIWPIHILFQSYVLCSAVLVIVAPSNLSLASDLRSHPAGVLVYGMMAKLGPPGTKKYQPQLLQYTRTCLATRG